MKVEIVTIVQKQLCCILHLSKGPSMKDFTLISKSLILRKKPEAPAPLR